MCVCPWPKIEEDIVGIKQCTTLVGALKTGDNVGSEAFECWSYLGVCGYLEEPHELTGMCTGEEEGINSTIAAHQSKANIYGHDVYSIGKE